MTGEADNGSTPLSGDVPSVPRTLYAATVPQRFHAPLGGAARADVCVVGGGFTGLSAALHLAEAGRSVVLLEAQRIGWGASGRNGGQVHSGQRRDQIWLEKTVGRDDAAKLWELSEAAKDLVRARIARHAIACEWTDGLIGAAHTSEALDDERQPCAVPPYEPETPDEKRWCDAARRRRALRQELEREHAAIRAGEDL